MNKPMIAHLAELARQREQAHQALLRAIVQELDERQGRDLSLIARSVGWTPQYIGKIRDGQVKSIRELE